MEHSPVCLVWAGRCTTSDVIATTVTTKCAPAAVLRRAVKSVRALRSIHLPYRPPPSTMPNSLPHSKRCQMLIKERDEFMKLLHAEREERERTERVAATRIQVRGVAVGARQQASSAAVEPRLCVSHRSV